MRTFGVEEELLIADPVDGIPLALANGILETTGPDDGPSLKSEFKQEQIEVNSRPCTSAVQLREEIHLGRALADSAARTLGARVAALATPPVFHATPTLGNQRYATMGTEFGLVSREQLTCGFHVHVAIENPEEGVAVLDRMRHWLPVLLALSANSPFWMGVDTGFASYRTQIWNRWPTAGPMDVFGSEHGYRSVLEELLKTGVPLDEGMIYFDARLSRGHPTVELRIADVCLYAEDALTIAVLARALVETSARQWREGVPPSGVLTSVLRMANWRSSRFGVENHLLHPAELRPSPAAEVLEALLAHVHEALADADDLEPARAGVSAILRRGTGERLQRKAYGRGMRLADVVTEAIDSTHRYGVPDAGLLTG
ncbi:MULTISPECIES: glutamate--cysteine ligase [Paenarthrobacter]|uniref:glutamate--cysteine ligase 2 n=1 Tax=Paenarthrobacter TaxID=1742992 RepID=UPI00074D4125|nr:glutamate--cysteine ligase [Paenarthrobacter ureafaciens]AMB42324.1 carboxylate--amine ligase [Arthrobacter sp. ATCC 21022]KUR64083.1 carboxylate--amine ligase [Arthrobacter sp. ATCC 21022]MBN9130261.1 glutamate--cysteine ligase [Paenarthrobacter ureafaciens]RWW95221.1 YbdK family carboxylate-amine ligase [Paenarthrobacter ureafaciens]